MNDIQQRVQEAINELVESEAERGLQVAVYRRGEKMVDAVTGVADPATGRPVTSDTPFFSYSIGKGVASTVVHVLAERGVLDYDTPIVELWPELLGEVDGVRLISPERLREVSTVAMTATDEIFGFPISWGLGFDTAEQVAGIVTKAIAESQPAARRTSINRGG